jgi:hypothetical protein
MAITLRREEGGLKNDMGDETDDTWVVQQMKCWGDNVMTITPAAP